MSKPFQPEFIAFGRPNFGQGEIEAVSRVLLSGWIGMGAEVIAFEEELAAFTGARHVVTVNSCTSALFLSLRVLDVGPGDEVICPSLTWCSTANAALYLGATPVFCDVDPYSLCVTPDTILEKITPKTRAVMVVHMGGLAVDVGAIRKVLPDRVAIVEDAAHALGARYPDGRSVGSSGNLTCFSFYANKNLSTGEGGALALMDRDVAERLGSLRQHGLISDAWRRYIHPLNALVPGIGDLGYKMNFTDLQASIGRVQLRRQAEFSRLRLSIAKRYARDIVGRFADIGLQSAVLDQGHARHLFQVMLPVDRMRMSRNDALLELRKRNIGASVHYAPLHVMPFYEPYRTTLPVTEELERRIMSLPIGASMFDKDVDYIVEHFCDVLKES
jgi:perosamine synthetase